MQKHSGGSGGAVAAAARGAVKRVDRDTVYVTGSDGRTVKVKLDASTKMVRTAKSSGEDVHPGDTVIVTGTTASSGTLTATSVTATGAGATGSAAG